MNYARSVKCGNTLSHCLLVILLCLPLLAYANVEADIALGRNIYVLGKSDGNVLIKGKRGEDMEMTGEEIACIKCHRASGMGSLEGNIVVPPIAGRFLFASEEDRPIALIDPRAPKNLTRAHKAYDEGLLAKAINTGIDVQGHQMNALMPRYQFNAKEIKGLNAYLSQLSQVVSPGVTDTTIHFATIVTPEVAANKKLALTSMMKTAFLQRNASQQSISGRMKMPLDLIPRTPRNWELSIWELQGDAETWHQQLTNFYQQQPVFAVISGASEQSWEPIQQFCTQQHLPCLLPSSKLPAAEEQFYNVYFSAGVRLEAQVLAKYLLDQGQTAPQQVLSIHTNDAAGRAATESLRQALNKSGVVVEEIVWSRKNAAAIQQRCKKLGRQDALVTWLNSNTASKLLNSTAAKTKASIYVSDYMLQDQHQKLPQVQRDNLRLIYPYELQSKRNTEQSQQLKNWLRTWNLANVDENFQAEVFFNLLLLTDLTSQMLDNLYRDYFIERVEDMLSWGANLTNYPHLSLASGQRFASKGAYIVGLAKDGKLTPVSDWIIP